MQMKISIIICTRNRGPSLQLVLEHLNRCCSNSEIFSEILIVDDASETDYMLPQSKIQIRIIKNSRNLGLLKSRILGAEEALNDYVWFMDDDDLIESSVFARIAEEIKGEPDMILGIVGLKNLRVCGHLRDFIYDGFTPPNSLNVFKRSSFVYASYTMPYIKSGVDHHHWFSMLNANKTNYVALRVRKNKRTAFVDIQDTMTGHLETRETNIRESIKIWRENLSHDFKDDFFEYLSDQYFYHNRQKILFHSLRNIDFSFARQRTAYTLKLIAIIIFRALKMRLSFDGATFEKYYGK